MVNYFKTDPTLKNQFDEACCWTEWRYNGGKADIGIDLAARCVEDERQWGIRCERVVRRRRPRTLAEYPGGSGLAGAGGCRCARRREWRRSPSTVTGCRLRWSLTSPPRTYGARVPLLSGSPIGCLRGAETAFNGMETVRTRTGPCRLLHPYRVP